MGTINGEIPSGLLARLGRAFQKSKPIPEMAYVPKTEIRPALNINWLPGTHPPSVYLGQQEPMQPRHLVDYLADDRREFPFIYFVDDQGVKFKELHAELHTAEGSAYERIKKHITQHFNINNHPEYARVMQRLRQEYDNEPEWFCMKPLDFTAADISGLEADGFFLRKAKAATIVLDHAELPYLDAVGANISRARANATIMPYSDLRGADARLMFINDKTVLGESLVDAETQIPLRYLSRFEVLKEMPKLESYMREHGKLLPRPMLVQLGAKRGINFESAEALHYFAAPYGPAKPL